MFVPVGRLCNRRVRGWRRRGALSDHGLLLCERSEVPDSNQRMNISSRVAIGLHRMPLIP
jgi:hypothetical protein